MSVIRNVYIDGCDVVWDDAKVNESDTVFDVNDAIEFSLYESDLDTDDENGDVVTGVDGLSMTFVATSNGKFVGHLPASVSLTRHAFYWLEVTATPDGGSPHTRRALVQAIHHPFNA